MGPVTITDQVASHDFDFRNEIYERKKKWWCWVLPAIFGIMLSKLSLWDFWTFLFYYKQGFVYFNVLLANGFSSFIYKCTVCVHTTGCYYIVVVICSLSLLYILIKICSAHLYFFCIEIIRSCDTQSNPLYKITCSPRNTIYHPFPETVKLVACGPFFCTKNISLQ